MPGGPIDSESLISLPMHPPLLHMRNIVKRYPGVLALNNVSFTLERAEVHCLLGENGAGKSTLMKILAGAVTMDSGEILIDQERVDVDSPSAAQGLGVSTIFQEINLVPDLTVAENILLGHEPTLYHSMVVDKRALHAKARNMLTQLGEEIDTFELVKSLSTAKRQIVEIAKALSRRVRFLVMDEPTASLTEKEIRNLFSIIRRLVSEGISVIYISHRLEEVFKIGDRVSVLRDGKNVATASMEDVTLPELIRWMIGRELQNEYPRAELKKQEEILRVENLSTRLLKRVSFSLHKGEILGFAGLVGSGRTELARAIFGADPISEGSLQLWERNYDPRSPQHAIRSGIGLLTEDRNNAGLLLKMNVRENITIAHLRSLSTFSFVHKLLERRAVAEFVDRIHIKTGSTEAGIETLSGGNRQKVVLSRWLFTNSRLLIFDEPTVGIDVGAKFEIYQLTQQLATNGVGVIVISSDMSELLGLCTRIAVMCAGRISGFLDRGEATQEKILTLATMFDAIG